MRQRARPASLQDQYIGRLLAVQQRLAGNRTVKRGRVGGQLDPAQLERLDAVRRIEPNYSAGASSAGYFAGAGRFANHASKLIGPEPLAMRNSMAPIMERYFMN